MRFYRDNMPSLPVCKPIEIPELCIIAGLSLIAAILAAPWWGWLIVQAQIAFCK